jgi:hypothetical protein
MSKTTFNFVSQMMGQKFEEFDTWPKAEFELET